MTVNTALVKALQSALQAHANPEHAGPMQAYMKSAMPFRGVQIPLRRKLTDASVKLVACKSTVEPKFRS